MPKKNRKKMTLFYPYDEPIGDIYLEDGEIKWDNVQPGWIKMMEKRRPEGMSDTDFFNSLPKRYRGRFNVQPTIDEG